MTSRFHDSVVRPGELCAWARGQISLDLDGEITELERVVVATHVARCRACAAFQNDLVAVTSMLHGAALEPLGDSVVVALPRRRPSFARVTPVAALSVATAAAFAVAVLVQHLSGPAARTTSRQDVRPAYLDSPAYEMRLIRTLSQRGGRFLDGSVMRPV